MVPYIRYVLTGSGIGRLKYGGNRRCSYWGIGFSLLIGTSKLLFTGSRSVGGYFLLTHCCEHCYRFSSQIVPWKAETFP